MPPFIVPIAVTAGLLAMLAVFVWAARAGRKVRSLEREEREGLRGAEGLRHSEDRADPTWVKQTSPGTTSPMRAVVDHTIADADRTGD